MPTTPPQHTVLIVDDDRANRMILAELLHEDCQVILAKDGTSALQRAREEKNLSLILLDVSMPKMNGYRVLQQLQADERTAHIPVIFITGLTDQEDEERGLLLGAVDYVVKPIRPAIVRARIRNHLKLEAQRRMLEFMAGQDGLTGISNRRHFDEALDMACRLASRTGDPISVAMIDVDYFKQYNDLYGHGAGDDVLRQIARVVASYARRPYDVAARYGGEEFTLLLPGILDLLPLLDKLRRDVTALAIPHSASTADRVVSISIGAASTHCVGTYDPADLLARADDLLYQAKREGRNRVAMCGETQQVHSTGTSHAATMPPTPGA